MNETCPTCGAGRMLPDVEIERRLLIHTYGCGAEIEYARVTGGWQFNRRIAPCGNPPAQGDMAIRTGSALGLPTISGS